MGTGTGDIFCRREVVVSRGVVPGIGEISFGVNNLAILLFIQNKGDIVKITNGKNYYKTGLRVVACWHGVLC